MLLPKSIKSLGKNIIKNTNEFVDILYSGNQKLWNEIEIDPTNQILNQAKVYYYAPSSESVICENQFWAYNGENNISIWRWDSQKEEWYI